MNLMSSILANDMFLQHPMHLHGHQFQIIERSDPKAGKFSGQYSKLPATPIRRDTVMVQNEGYAVIRFRADNPG
jgi:iron transport multicopper oxidase